MTALAVYYTEKELTVAMDTLASNPDKTPFKPVSKIIPILHCHSVLCPLGDINLGHAMYVFIEQSIFCYDIDNLIKNLKLAIQTFFDWGHNTFKTPLEGTLYIFGYSLEDECFKGYAFRSDGKNAKIEQLPEGFIVRPGEGIIDKETLEPLTYFDKNDIPTSLALAVIKMRNVDRSKPEKERVGIGCQIQITVVGNKGYTLTTWEMDDYIETYNECCEKNLNRQL